MKLLGVSLAAMLVLATIVNAQLNEKADFKFDFGTGEAAKGWFAVSGEHLYPTERGFGFERGAEISCPDQGGPDPLRGDACTSNQPFFFSVALPEGNYSVTVLLGDAQNESTTTVKAELRRLFVEQAHTRPGEFIIRTFVVNIRTPKIRNYSEVKLKDREKTTEIWAWDGKLTLEFSGERSSVAALTITKVENIPMVYLLGDSTVADQPLAPYSSWGQMLPRFFKPGVAVANHAESGESLGSSLSSRRLAKVLSLMNPGDYVLIQYGHNDEKEKGEGVGAFTTFKRNLKRFVSTARRVGGIPVLVTPVQRRTFDQKGRITNSHGDYPEAVRQLAKEERIPLIDLHAMSTTLYEALGPERSKLAFKDGDRTHHNNYGSYQLAKCIVEGIKANKLSIAKYLVRDLVPFDPAKPDPIESASAFDRLQFQACTGSQQNRPADNSSAFSGGSKSTASLVQLVDLPVRTRHPGVPGVGEGAAHSGSLFAVR